jgi:hypothetical protein
VVGGVVVAPLPLLLLALGAAVATAAAERAEALVAVLAVRADGREVVLALGLVFALQLGGGPVADMMNLFRP